MNIDQTSVPQSSGIVLTEEDVSIETTRTDSRQPATTERLSDDSWQANGQNKQNFQKN